MWWYNIFSYELYNYHISIYAQRDQELPRYAITSDNELRERHTNTHLLLSFYEQKLKYMTTIKLQRGLSLLNTHIGYGIYKLKFMVKIFRLFKNLLGYLWNSNICATPIPRTEILLNYCNKLYYMILVYEFTIICLNIGVN